MTDLKAYLKRPFRHGAPPPLLEKRIVMWNDLGMKLGMTMIVVSAISMCIIFVTAVGWVVLAVLGFVDYPWNVPAPGQHYHYCRD